ncbi:MAG: DUF1232 domain-containing protein [Candidatus Aminicenantes bacterium]|nr:DUF1232 domain-containing protein [Candidatus Aminicenantes bacterium]MCK5005692.1 DUF1232 domain-containing protein [Candidatus Aminicenantes bacterium]
MGKLPVKKKGSFDDFYLKIRKKVTDWFESGKLGKKSGKWMDDFVQYLLIFPDLIHLMIKLFGDKEVPTKTKGMIVIGFAYLLSPVDVIPDFIPVFGFVDDLLISVVLLNKIINSGDEVMIDKIKFYWVGEDDIFRKIKEIVAAMNELSSKIPKSISGFFNKHK